MGNVAGIIMMAYGSPDSPDDIVPYLADIKARYARKGTHAGPTEEEIARLRRRYGAIGGLSPFNRITNEQAGALRAELERRGVQSNVYIGMKHWKPKISDAVSQIVRDGVGSLTALPMAPYYSTMSTEGYRMDLEAALEGEGAKPEIRFIRDWHMNGAFIDSWSESLRAAIRAMRTTVDDTRIVFTTHSLPSAILKIKDPYPAQFAETAAAVATAVGSKNWSIAYQSGGGRDGWLGPDITAVLEGLVSSGGGNVLVAPIGFVAENLETMYDIDIECVRTFKGRGLNISRAAAPNASPRFVDALVSVVTGVERA